MPPSSNHRKNAHTTQKKNTDSTPAKKTPPVTPNANPHNEDTIKSLAARIDIRNLQGMLTASSSKKLTILDETEEQITAKT